VNNFTLVLACFVTCISSSCVSNSNVNSPSDDNLKVKHVYTFLTNNNENKLTEFEKTFFDKINDDSFNIDEGVSTKTTKVFRSLGKINVGLFQYVRNSSLIKIKYIYNDDDFNALTKEDQKNVNSVIDTVSEISANTVTEITN
jgi:hypothetical protein